MHLTKFSDYSLRMLLYLAVHADRPVSIGEVSRAYNISPHILVKVVQLLIAEGLVTSVRGRLGGLRLTRQPGEINVGALVRRTENNWNLVECFDVETNTCPIEPVCGLKGVLKHAQAAFVNVLDNHTAGRLHAARAATATAPSRVGHAAGWEGDGVTGMSIRLSKFVALAGIALLAFGVSVAGQLSAPFSVAHRHPAIDYWTRPAEGPVADLERRIHAGEVTLRYEGQSGYLKSVLDALKVPVESQILVFSKTSFQAPLISPGNPRALYFNDQVAVGWIRGSKVLEFASEDPEQGAMFYTMANDPERPPQFKRSSSCLSCHVTTSTLEVPGMFVGSVHPGADGMPLYAPVYEVDHRTPLELRWGGWYVPAVTAPRATWATAWSRTRKTSRRSCPTATRTWRRSRGAWISTATSPRTATSSR